jgi:hypothetical protein
MRDIIAECPDQEIDRMGAWVTTAFFTLGWLVLLYPLVAFLASP